MPKFQFETLGIWGNEETWREGQYRGILRCKKAVCRKEGLLTYMWIITEIYPPTLYSKRYDDFFSSIYIFYKPFILYYKIWRWRCYLWNKYQVTRINGEGRDTVLCRLKEKKREKYKPYKLWKIYEKIFKNIQKLFKRSRFQSFSHAFVFSFNVVLSLSSGRSWSLIARWSPKNACMKDCLSLLNLLIMFHFEHLPPALITP